MLYRDDDINIYTSLWLFMKVDELFQKYNKIHTIAIEVKDLWENKELFNYILRSLSIQVGLHGWTHRDYSIMPYEDVLVDLQKAIEYWEQRKMGGYGDLVKTPLKKFKTFYPTWNRVSPELKRACDTVGLELDSRERGSDLYSFHYWALTDKKRFDALEELLRR